MYGLKRHKVSGNSNLFFLKKKPNLQQLTINDYPVEHVNSAKSFGVMFIIDLKWNEHVEYIVKQSSRRLSDIKT